MSPTYLALVHVVFLVLPLSVIGVWSGARRLRGQPRLPRFVPWVACALTLPAVVLVGGAVVYDMLFSCSAVSQAAPDPLQNASALVQQGTKFKVFCGASLFSALLGATFLAFSAWKWQPKAPSDPMGQAES